MKRFLCNKNTNRIIAELKTNQDSNLPHGYFIFQGAEEDLFKKYPYFNWIEDFEFEKIEE